MLLEDEKSVNHLLDHLNKKILTYKSHPKYKQYVPYMLKFNKETISPMLTNYLDKLEVDKNRENQFKNDILDFINMLDSIFR